MCWSISAVSGPASVSVCLSVCLAVCLCMLVCLLVCVCLRTCVCEYAHTRAHTSVHWKGCRKQNPCYSFAQPLYSQRQKAFLFLLNLGFPPGRVLSAEVRSFLLRTQGRQRGLGLCPRTRTPRLCLGFFCLQTYCLQLSFCSLLMVGTQGRCVCVL